MLAISSSLVALTETKLVRDHRHIKESGVSFTNDALTLEFKSYYFSFPTFYHVITYLITQVYYFFCLFQYQEMTKHLKDVFLILQNDFQIGKAHV